MKKFHELDEHIVIRNGKYVVTDKAGVKVLGTHDTEAEAKRQLAAIEISKNAHDK